MNHLNTEYQPLQYFDLRKKKDGKTFFGFDSKMNGEVVNDFLFPVRSNEEKETLKG